MDCNDVRFAIDAAEIEKFLTPEDGDRIRAWGEQAAIEASFAPDDKENNPHKNQAWLTLAIEMWQRNRVWIDIPEANGGVLVSFNFFSGGAVGVYSRRYDKYHPELMHNFKYLDPLMKALRKAQKVIGQFQAAYDQAKESQNR